MFLAFLLNSNIFQSEIARENQANPKDQKSKRKNKGYISKPRILIFIDG